MSFENGELNFRRPRPKLGSESESNEEERGKPVDPILEDELEEAAKKQADDLLEQEEINKATKAIERQEATEAARKKKAWKELDSEKDYLGPQRYDQAAWDKYNKKKKKTV